MLPNKSGVCLSSGLPDSGTVTRYLAGDILISNIRPYFKKIWFADKSGGASNDVLVIRAKKSSQKYLYYLLCSDTFFDYVMSGAKGTKMPRGDKFQIMEFSCNFPPISKQREIAAILGSLDDKIEANRQQNKTLEAIAQALFKSWFVDFEPVKAKSE
jgi:type I restriction enzyme S subunit